MKPERQQRVITEECGWSRGHWAEYASTSLVGPVNSGRIWHSTKATGPGGEVRDSEPDYLHDLNAMHDAEKKLSLENRRYYTEYLNMVVDREYRMASVTWLTVNSTAAQRAEAFLRALGKWEEE